MLLGCWGREGGRPIRLGRIIIRIRIEFDLEEAFFLSGKKKGKRKGREGFFALRGKLLRGMGGDVYTGPAGNRVKALGFERLFTKDIRKICFLLHHVYLARVLLSLPRMAYPSINFHNIGDGSRFTLLRLGPALDSR